MKNGGLGRESWSAALGKHRGLGGCLMMLML
jgi:hypothetical protein